MEKTPEYALEAGIAVWISDNINLVNIAQKLGSKCVNLGLCDTEQNNPFQIVPTDVFAQDGNLHHQIFLNINHIAWGYFRIFIENESKYSVIEPSIISETKKPIILLSQIEVEEYIDNLAKALDLHYQILDYLDLEEYDKAIDVANCLITEYHEKIDEPLREIKNIIDNFDGEIEIKATNDDTASQSVKTLDTRYDLALLHPENWVVKESNVIDGQSWLSSWLKTFFVKENKAASLVYLCQKLFSDHGVRIKVITDSVYPETDVTAEVLRDEALNLCLVRPVIHALRMELINE